MIGRSAHLTSAVVLLTATAISGCAGPSDSIVASDAALCEYSLAAAGAASEAQCRARLQTHRGRMVVASASRIEGYALLNDPLPPSDVAGTCKESDKSKNCDPESTGSIPAPKR